MNPETLYPELKEMKSSEIFVEWAYIVKEFGYTKVFVRRIIPKKETPMLIKALRMEYCPAVDPENPKFSAVNLVTIEQ